MNDLPASARGIWSVTVAAGVVAVLVALLEMRGEQFDLLAAGVLVGGGIAANFFTLRLPSSAREHHRQETTVASAVYVSSLLLFPPAVAIVVTALGYGVAWAIRPGDRP